MPTRRRRHAVTETPRVQLALDELRRELGTDQLEIAELVILGAHEKLARLRGEQHREEELIRRLARRIRSRDISVDLEAAAEVRRTGWVRR